MNNKYEDAFITFSPSYILGKEKVVITFHIDSEIIKKYDELIDTCVDVLESTKTGDFEKTYTSIIAAKGE